MGQPMPVQLISELQAIVIAESFVEGLVYEMELATIEGQYVYELILKTNEGRREVYIDAITGAVLNKT